MKLIFLLKMKEMREEDRLNVETMKKAQMPSLSLHFIFSDAVCLLSNMIQSVFLPASCDN